MKTISENGVLTIFLQGRIDSANSNQIEKELNASVSEHSPSGLILDAEQLEYISSAGLRVILKLKKQFADMSIINVSSEVYEIFDMTGFTEIVDVQKAFRVLDVTGCEVIGEGANGKVYRIDKDTIVKVYKNADSLDKIKLERELSRTAFILGVPTAIPYDVVKVGDTYGSVFELLNAKSFDELLREDEGKLGFVIDEIVKISKIIHDTDAPLNLQYQRDTALQWVEEVNGCFTDQEQQKLRSLIEAIPDNGKMIHGDLHIKNVMLQNDETLLIDMDTLCVGHPIYELAFMFNAYKGFGVADSSVISNFLRISPELAYSLWRGILKSYLGTDDEAKLNEVEQKAALIGYLRVMRRVTARGEQDTESGSKLYSICRAKISDLLSKVDELTFEPA